MAAPSPAAALDGGTKASWRRHWARGLAARGGAARALRCPPAPATRTDGGDGGNARAMERLLRKGQGVAAVQGLGTLTPTALPLLRAGNCQADLGQIGP